MRKLDKNAERKFMSDMRKIFENGIWIPKKVPPIFGRAMPDSLVAVMDILGFKEIIKHNVSVEAMQLLCLSLENAMRSAQGDGMYRRYFHRTQNLPIQKIIAAQKRIETYLFSDTLILICPNISQGKEYAAFGFLEAACGAVRALFEHGYPVRAFIDYGDCYRSDRANFVIGQPFHEAFQEAEKLSFSGLCISDAAKNVICRDTAEAHRWGIDVIPVPVKGYVAQVDRNCVDWLRTAHDKNFSTRSVEKLVYDSFTKDGKTVATDRVKELLGNTVKVIKAIARAQKPRRK